MRLSRTYMNFFLVMGISLSAGFWLGAHSQERAPSAAAAASQPSDPSLPKDVYPESRNRLPLLKREQFDEDGKKQFDTAAADALVGLQGPMGIRLYSLRLGQLMRPLGQYIRFETDLGRRLSELAILVTAREIDQQFEWTVHEPEARKQGLEQEIIDVVKYRKPLTGLGEKETVIIQLGREIFGKRKVSPDTFAQALKLFGAKTLLDLSTLMGEYASTGAVLTTFDQQILAGQKPLLPIP